MNKMSCQRSRKFRWLPKMRKSKKFNYGKLKRKDKIKPKRRKMQSKLLNRISNKFRVDKEIRNKMKINKESQQLFIEFSRHQVQIHTSVLRNLITMQAIIRMNLSLRVTIKWVLKILRVKMDLKNLRKTHLLVKASTTIRIPLYSNHKYLKINLNPKVKDNNLS